MDDPIDGTTTFTQCRSRLERALASSQRPGDVWAARIAAAVRAALELADENRALGLTLAAPAASHRREPDPSFAAMVERLAALWLRGAPPVPSPERAARNHVRRIARQVLLHLEARPHSPLSAIAPDLIVFVLTPYVGLAEARRWAGG